MATSAESRLGRFQVASHAASAVLLYLLIAGTGVPDAFASDPKKSTRSEILVLHSYGADYQWTQSEEKGVESIFKPLSDDYDLRIEYMDSTRSPGLLHELLLRRLYKERFAGPHLKLILTSDNAAFDFLRQYRDELFPGVPVVFMGVNGYEDGMIRGLRGFTGVAEDVDFLGTFNVALTLHPNAKRIVLPGMPDDSTYRGNAAIIRPQLPRLLRAVEIEFHQCSHMDACVEDLRKLPPDSIVSMIGNYRTSTGSGINNQRSIEIVSSAIDLPVYTEWDFGVEHGAVGGSVMTGTEQGRLAAEIALRVLRGETPEAIPVRRNVGTAYAFDYRQMARFKLRPDQLPAGATIVNRPDPVYRIPQEAFWTALCSFAALAAAVVALALNTRRRKIAEDHLKSANKQLEDIIEFLPDATFIIGKDKKVLAWNRAMETMTGVLKRDIIGKDHHQTALPFYGKPRPYLMDLVDSHDGELASLYTNIARVGQMLTAESFAPALYDGAGAHIWCVACPLLDRNGELMGAIESIRDITDRKRAEEATRQANERFKSILRAATAYSIIGTGPDGIITVFNEGAELMLGYRADEVIGKITPEIIHAPEEMAARAAELGVQTGFEALVVVARQGQAETREWTYVRKDGSRLFVSLTVAAMRSERGDLTGFIGVARDVTGQKKLEHQLVQAQKMEIVGRLAGGIAHDFNNLLTPMIGYSDLLLMECPSSDSRHELLASIEQAAKRARDLTRQLLAFSRKQLLELKVVDVGHLVLRLEKMLQRTIGENIRIEVLVAPSLGAVRADAGQIEQVLMNLAVNARDAMPHGGVLQIAAENVVLDEAYASEHPELRPGPYVKLLVTDTGTGMSKDVQARLFEPFFTTKDEGRGTGLGLSTAYGIVKQHGGSLSVYSEPGIGSCFNVYLPRLPKPPRQGSMACSSAPLAPARGTETILVVEDNGMVRKVACTMLARLGYRVIAAESGDAALRIADEYQEAIDLLLTDLVLPKMDGKEIAQLLAAKRQGLKILYMSGYTDKVIVHHGGLQEGIHFVQKPLSFESLSTKVRQILDS